MDGHNDVRSLMAESWLNHLYGDQFEAKSAGLEPKAVNPLAVKAMQEVGIDISQKLPRKVFELVKDGELFSYVITIFDQAGAEKLPFFPGLTIRLQWNFPDPATFSGNEEEKMEKIRKLRDDLKAKIEAWVDQLTKGEMTLFPNSLNQGSRFKSGKGRGLSAEGNNYEASH
jgi:arsenate reductase